MGGRGHVEHAEGPEKGLGTRCIACGGPWPCRTFLLREHDDLAAAREELAALLADRMKESERSFMQSLLAERDGVIVELRDQARRLTAALVQISLAPDGHGIAQQCAAIASAALAQPASPAPEPSAAGAGGTEVGE